MGKMNIGGDTVLVLSGSSGAEEVKDKEATETVVENDGEDAEKTQSVAVESSTPSNNEEVKDPAENAPHCYDKAKSFFDSISCEAVERSKG